MILSYSLLDEKADLKMHLYKSRETTHYASRQMTAVTQLLVLPSHTHFYVSLKIITKGTKITF